MDFRNPTRLYERIGDALAATESQRSGHTPEEGTATQDTGASCDAEWSCSSQTGHHTRRARGAGSYLPHPGRPPAPKGRLLA